METPLTIREALPEEFTAVGQLMVTVYSQLEGFPSKEEFPDYFDMLSNVGKLTEQAGTKILIALSPDNEIWEASFISLTC